jgi:protein ImuB
MERGKGEPKEKRIEGEVRVFSGPWRVEEKWWSEEAIDREYWDVELSDGALYRIFRDVRNGGWFADGIYD